MINPLTYKEKFRKINILSLCAQSITILLVIFLIFVPIYKGKYKNFEDIENLEQLEEALEKGYIEKNFSLFDDCIILYEEFTAKDEGGQGYWILYEAMFPIFEILFGALTLFMICKQSTGSISGLLHPDDEAILKYNEIKKTGSEQKKQSWMKSQSAFTLVVYALFDIVFVTVFDKVIYPMMNITSSRNMADLSGISIFGYIALVLVVAFAVINFFVKREKRAVQLSIAKEELEI